MTSRERFEKEAVKMGWRNFTLLDNGHYAVSIINDIWQAWQEAERQALENAAHLLDIQDHDSPSMTPGDCADYLRSMMEQT